MVEDFCAECVEPAPGAACEKQDAGPALDGQNGAGSSGYESYISGLLIRVAPPDSVWSLPDLREFLEAGKRIEDYR